MRLFLRAVAAVALLAAVWGLGTVPPSGPHVSVRPVGTPRGPVRILQFYATVGTLVAGEKAQLCYGVENAKSVRISPALPNVYPATNRCVDIVPKRTTHYTIMAEGFDGGVAARFFTLVVQPVPEPRREPFNFAD
ncbi:MAG TPA: hypothetical protein VLY04_19600 [Bryobacteraceae bacterium]|nr:hypothetical protein [Bryobacteraceae bacterium]